MKHIDAFLEKAPYHVGVDSSDDDDDEAIAGIDLGVDEFEGLGDELFPQSLPEENEDEDGDTLPEKIVLPLPSSFTLADRSLRGITKKMAAVEMQIRIGQADETLHEIRDIIGHKSFIFRKEIRHAQGQSASTRSWRRIQTIDASLKTQCQIYSQCRRALVGLAASNRILDRYKVLTKDHIKASTVVVGNNIPGDRSPNLSWIWSMDVAGDTETSERMEDCRLPEPHYMTEAN